jgi:hypothetical protein
LKSYNFLRGKDQVDVQFLMKLIIIKNKSEKREMSKIRMAARHWQWRVSNAPLPVASFTNAPLAVTRFLRTRHWQ